MIKVQSHHLQPGDIVGSNEIVMGVSSGIDTPKGKIEVKLEKNGRWRIAVWGKYTLINVERKAVK